MGPQLELVTNIHVHVHVHVRVLAEQKEKQGGSRQLGSLGAPLKTMWHFKGLPACRGEAGG